MTASTNKKRRNKRKTRRSGIVFVTVLLFVLTIGGLLLALTALRQAAALPDDSLWRRAEEKAGEQERESLLFHIQSEVVTHSEEPQQPNEAERGRYDMLLQDAVQMKEQKIYAKEAASSQEIVLAFAGDILFDKNYAMMANLRQRGGKIEEAFSKELLDVMRSADVFLVNNEFPYTNRGTPLSEKQFTFRAEPETADYLTDMGVDIVSLANNHAYDYGEISLLDTLETLEQMEMPYVGAGRNLEEASKPASFIMNDKKISIVAATQIERNDNPDTKGASENSAGTFRCWNVENLLKAVEKAKKESDYVIVYIHWGTENQAETDWAQDEQVVKIAQAGADAIIGAHSHCLQPVGYVKGIPVVYSLGNFWFNSKTLDTAVARVVIPTDDEAQLRVQIVPAKQEDCRTRLLEGTEKRRVIEYLNEISTSGCLDEEGFLLPCS